MTLNEESKLEEIKTFCISIINLEIPYFNSDDNIETAEAILEIVNKK